MQVLPHGPTHGARDPDKVVKSTESAGDGRLDEIGVSINACTSADATIAQEFRAVHLTADHQAAKTPVPDEQVSTPTEQEVWDAEIPHRQDGLSQVIRGSCVKEPVGGASDLERGQRCEWRIHLHSARTEALIELKKGFLSDHRPDFAPVGVDMPRQDRTFIVLQEAYPDWAKHGSGLR